MPTSSRTIGRLSLYRRLLGEMLAEGIAHVFSHQLAALAGVTAAQVRRDLMSIGYAGSTKRGYSVAGLSESICEFLDAAQLQGIALVGVGNLGRAIMSYFAGRRPNLAITAAFDADTDRTGRVIGGVRCYAMDEMDAVLAEQDIQVGIIAVPADAAQDVADRLVRAGVRGILNFAPVALRVPSGVYVEHNDITMSLEKVAYFARPRQVQRSVSK